MFLHSFIYILLLLICHPSLVFCQQALEQLQSPLRKSRTRAGEQGIAVVSRLRDETIDDFRGSGLYEGPHFCSRLLSFLAETSRSGVV